MRKKYNFLRQGKKKSSGHIESERGRQKKRRETERENDHMKRQYLG